MSLVQLSSNQVQMGSGEMAICLNQELDHWSSSLFSPNFGPDFGQVQIGSGSNWNSEPDDDIPTLCGDIASKSLMADHSEYNIYFKYAKG